MRTIIGILRRAALLTCLIPLAVCDSHAQGVRLIVRGDDFGMTQGSLEAIEKGFNEGVLTCTSIIVPGPWFEGAAALVRKNPGWCTGIHLAVVGEWRGYSWRPVLPWDKVKSLVDEDGFLYGSPRELFTHKPHLAEIDAEFRAQIELAKRKGIPIHYIDTHYIDTKEYPGLDEVVRRIAKDYDVPVSQTIGETEFDVYSTPVDQKMKAAVDKLGKLGPGLWMWMAHVGIDSPEQRALIHTDPNDIFLDGGVGANRAEELRVVTSLQVKSMILKRRITLTSYKELWRREKAGR